MTTPEMMIADPVERLREALRLFLVGNKTKAIHAVFGPTHTNDYQLDAQLNNLYMETYIFFTDGDLRKKGRDFGYASVSEIQADLDRYVAARD